MYFTVTFAPIYNPGIKSGDMISNVLTDNPDLFLKRLIVYVESNDYVQSV